MELLTIGLSHIDKYRICGRSLRDYHYQWLEILYYMAQNRLQWHMCSHSMSSSNFWGFFIPDNVFVYISLIGIFFQKVSSMPTLSSYHWHHWYFFYFEILSDNISVCYWAMETWPDLYSYRFYFGTDWPTVLINIIILIVLTKSFYFLMDKMMFLTEL